MVEPEEIFKDYLERPIPNSWRPTIVQIVEEFSQYRYNLTDLPNVDPVDGSTAAIIERIIKKYGCSLVSLPEETWNSSISVWDDGYWVAIVDLFTIEEGRSDLVLHLNITENNAGYKFNVHLVYVP